MKKHTYSDVSKHLAPSIRCPGNGHFKSFCQRQNDEPRQNLFSVMVGKNHRVAEMSIRYRVDASSGRLRKYHISLSMRINQFYLTETLLYLDFSDSWISDTRPTFRRGPGHMYLKWSRIIPSTRETRDSIGRRVPCFGSLISQETSGPWRPKRVRP